MLHLKDDMDVSSLTFLGTIAHILGPIYLSECFPKVTVLNLGKQIVFDSHLTGVSGRLEG